MDEKEMLKADIERLKSAYDELQKTLNYLKDVDGLNEQYDELYSNEEYKTIKIILGKQKEDNYFTKDELDFIEDFDLSDKALPEIAKLVLKHRNNTKFLDAMLKILKGEEIEEYNNIFYKVKKVTV